MGKAHMLAYPAGLNVYFNLRLIRNYRECEGRKEKSVPRIAVWHHEAYRVTNGDPKGRILLSYPNSYNELVFLLKK